MYKGAQVNCLLVNLNADDLASSWQAACEGQDFGGLIVEYTDNATHALERIGSGDVFVLAIAAAESKPEIFELVRAFQTNVGSIADFQAVICAEPEPKFMAAVFEFGIEQFVAPQTWAPELASIARAAAKLMSNPESPEAKTYALCRSIRSADQAAIQKAEQAIGDIAEYDYRAAFAKGKAYEATGEYGKAADVFANAAGMNKMFRPSAASLGETLLVTGRIDEALQVFEKLERSNPYDVERKANMAAAYVEKGDYAKAQAFVEAAAKLSPNNSRVLEAQAQVLLCTGKVGDAFKLLDGMSEVGPFFAAKLNELGIKLSQGGKGKSALALYQKAHRIVRPELKYKISMNAALACRRLGAWDMAMKFLERCEKEYGSSFAKLEKIKEAVKAGKAQAAKPKPQTAPSTPKAG